MVEAYEEKSKRDMELLAWTCANIMNCWVKKQIRPTDLLPKNFRPGQKHEESGYVKKRFAAVGGIDDFKAQMRAKKQREEEANEAFIDFSDGEDEVTIVLDRDFDGFTADAEVLDGD